MTQEEWDLILVEAFVEHKDAQMWRLTHDWREYEGLRRGTKTSTSRVPPGYDSSQIRGRIPTQTG